MYIDLVGISDTWVSNKAIVVAKDEEDAKKQATMSCPIFYDNLTIIHIGIADKGLVAGKILSSYIDR